MGCEKLLDPATQTGILATSCIEKRGAFTDWPLQGSCKDLFFGHVVGSRG